MQGVVGGKSKKIIIHALRGDGWMDGCACKME
jgi:hypothetical protein